MNIILHGVHYRKFDIKQEDTLEKPQHMDERFEAIVVNPPFSVKWSANPLHLSDDRYSQYGMREQRPKLRERKPIAERLLEKVMGFVETFEDGMG